METRLGMLLVVSLFLFSCGSESAMETDTAKIEKQEVIADASMKMEIEGMVCSMGCVKTIEGGLNALPGIANCKVDYESRTATVSYDSKAMTDEQIVQELSKLHDGIYSGSLINEEESTNNEAEVVEVEV